MQFSKFSNSFTGAAALNWADYDDEPVTKDGACDNEDSTSAGSDSESGDHASSASDETHTDVESIPFYGELCSAMAMVWLMGSMNYQENAYGAYYPKQRRPRVPRGRAFTTPIATKPVVEAPAFLPPPGLPLPDAPPGFEFSMPPGLDFGPPKKKSLYRASTPTNPRTRGAFRNQIIS